jgi:polyhydroxyalkanoate synthesis regulator phasin
MTPEEAVLEALKDGPLSREAIVEKTELSEDEVGKSLMGLMQQRKVNYKDSLFHLFEIKWEKRKPVINEHMKSVLQATIGATTAEIASLKRKLKKLQYGS